MEIQELVVSASVKMNNGNYEATDFFISAKAIGANGGPIQPGDADRLQKAVQSALLSTLVKAHRIKGIATTPHMIAKHYGLSEGGPLASSHENLKKPKEE